MNITTAEVAKKIGTSDDKIQSWLDGTDLPTYLQLEKLSYKIFKRPLAVFFLKEIPEVLATKKKFRTLPGYIFDSTSYKTRLAVNKADFFKTVLYEVYKTNPSGKPLFKELNPTVEDNKYTLSKELRKRLNITDDIQQTFRNGYDAFNYYRNKLEEAGIFAYQLQLEGDRAFCLLDDEFPVIIINSGDYIFSKIFSLFHELVHILIKSDDILKDTEFPSYQETREEIFCNAVASEILVPSAEFKKFFGDSLNIIGQDIIFEIADFYKVSKEVIIRKIIDLGYYNKDGYDELKNLFPAKSGKKDGGGNFYTNKLSALGKNYVYKILSDWNNGLINDKQVSSYLDVKYSQIRNLEEGLYPK